MTSQFYEKLKSFARNRSAEPRVPGIPTSTTDETGVATLPTAPIFTFPLIDLPQELILEIFSHLPERDLVTLFEVSSLTKVLAIATVLASHGISECQSSQPLDIRITSQAVRKFGSSHPTRGTIALPSLQFNDGDIDHMPVWRSLLHLAKRSADIVLTLQVPLTKSPRLRRFWDPLLTSVLRLFGPSASHPVVIIHYLAAFCARPKQPSVLQREAPHILLAIDKELLRRNIKESIAATIKRQPLSRIHVRSFPQRPTPVGALVLLNPDSISFLNIDVANLSRTEWQFILPHLNLPGLRAVRIQANLDYEPLSSFLGLHARIEHLDFRRDWTGLYNERPFPVLHNLTRLTAGSHIIALALQSANTFNLLECVDISDQDTTMDDLARVAYFQAALRAVATRSSVQRLMIQMHDNIKPPWRYLDATSDDRPERRLRYIRTLHISLWTGEAEHEEFPNWLEMFPALTRLHISGVFLSPRPSSGGPVLSDWLAEAIKETCSRISVHQEGCL
ncbi:hypothetical protein B0H11DRAFT_2291185 [Mycena galericulata]|nr:hypothetical protein B0H11DRAFT_2291185 [Mycena galericulata]